MTRKENMLALLRHGTPPWIPWVPLIDRANTPCFVPEELKRNWNILDVSRFLHDELECDILVGAPIVKVRQREAKYQRTVQGKYIIEEYRICGRYLRTVTRRLEVGGQISNAITDYPVKDKHDLDTFEMIMDDRSLEYHPVEYETLRDGIGGMGLVSVSAPRTPVMDLIIDKMGVEAFTYAFMDYPDDMERLFSKMHALNREHYRMIANAGTDYEVVRMHEDQDSLLTSPDTYRRYIFPMMKEYCDICHEKGKLFMMHACGHVRAFLPMILETGIDAHHYLTDRPVGDTSPREAVVLWGDRITIMAAVDPLLQSRGNEEDVRRNLMKILEQLEPVRNFMIMSPLKPDIPEANIRILARTMKEYGITV